MVVVIRVARAAACAVVFTAGLVLWPLEIAVGRYLSWRNKRVW
jgi:hypothetical protein